MEYFLASEAWAGKQHNPKIVLVLGSPGSGKTYVAQQFQKHGFRLALLDQYFEAIIRKKTGQDKLNVSLQDPSMKQDYVWAAMRNDNRMEHYLRQGYPFVTEKTGQNYGTIVQLKNLVQRYGYDIYGIYVSVDVETALQRNANRKSRSLADRDELRRTHQKVASNMYPSDIGSGIQGLFGKDFFFEITNDGTPQNNTKLAMIVSEIVNRPIYNPKARIMRQETYIHFDFRDFWNKIQEAEQPQPGIIKTIDNPQEQGSMLVYNIRTILEPGKTILLVVPEQYRHLIIRDMILTHRKGPYGHGEPHMKFEPQKNKWRDYYGAYTRVEAHDTQTQTWHTYVDDYGASFKFAEHRPGEWEEETLHDWVRISKVKPDIIKLSNPGNQRAKPHPVTGEKIDPMDQRSSSEIASLKVVFFPNIDLTSGSTQFYERFYSKVGGADDSPARFANFASQNKDELEPTYGNYGAGIYPNALVLAADWSRQGRRIKQMDGRYYFIVDKESFNQVAGEMGDRPQRAVGGEPFYSRNGKEYVKVFPVTLDGGPGTKVQNNSLYINIPPEMNGKKLLQIEVMCGDTEFRPDRIARNQPWKRLGFAALHIGAQTQQTGTQWFTSNDGISVAPQMVAAAAPKQPLPVQSGDKVILRSDRDTTYVMGWRIAYA